jgi:hypothetical protein
VAVPSWLTVAIFAERMGITTPTGSALTIANMALEAAAGMVTNYLGFDPSVTAITEYLDGYGKRDVTLRRWPVTAVTSVYEDLGGYNGQPTSPTPFAADTLLTVGEDYTWCRSEGGTNGILTRIGGLWPYNWTREINRVAFSVGPLRGCIKVVYTIDNSDVLAAAQQAAYEGAMEVLPAATAATLAVLAVFLPVVFMDGVIGKFLFQFGITMSAAVILSLIEAITITPMRAAALLGKEHKVTKLEQKLDVIFKMLGHKYQNALKVCLNHKYKILAISMGLFILSMIAITQ